MPKVGVAVSVGVGVWVGIPRIAIGRKSRESASVTDASRTNSARATVAPAQPLFVIEASTRPRQNSAHSIIDQAPLGDPCCSTSAIRNAPPPSVLGALLAQPPPVSLDAPPPKPGMRQQPLLPARAPQTAWLSPAIPTASRYPPWSGRKHLLTVPIGQLRRESFPESSPCSVAASTRMEKVLVPCVSEMPLGAESTLVPPTTPILRVLVVLEFGAIGQLQHRHAMPRTNPVRAPSPRCRQHQGHALKQQGKSL